MIWIYSLVVLCATTIGAVAGLGGGVIIKPCFDMLAFHDAATIGVYSSIAVFTMCIVSIFKQLRHGARFDAMTVVMISIGSILGGFVGEWVFNQVNVLFPSEGMVKGTQALLLALTLVGILIYTLNKEKIRTIRVRNKLIIVLLGLFLGVVSVFLGIGGGPLNIALLTLFFSFDMKECVVYSIATIFFSQLSKLFQVFVLSSSVSYDLSPVPMICIAAVAGGYIGTWLNNRLTNRQVEKVYVATMICLLALSCFNAARGFLG